MAYLFVVATAILVSGIGVIFKSTAAQIIEQPDAINEIQTRYFIKVGILEIVPLMLVVIGFINLESILSSENLTTPSLFVLLFLLAGYFFYFYNRKLIAEQPPVLSLI